MRPSSPPSAVPGLPAAARQPGTSLSSADLRCKHLALAVKAAYVNARSHYQTMLLGSESTYQPPRRYDGHAPRGVEDRGSHSVWERLVQWCWANDLDPVDYVRTAFNTMLLPSGAQTEAASEGGRRLGAIPEPQHLMGSKTLERCRQAMPESDQQFKGTLAQEVDEAKGWLDHHTSVRKQSLLDGQLAVVYESKANLTSLFRYCLAASLVAQDKRFVRALEVYRGRAVEQLQLDLDRYRRVWGSFLPDELLRAAKRQQTKRIKRGRPHEREDV